MELISPDTKKLLTVSHLPGVGPAKLRKLLAGPNFRDLEVDDLVQMLPALSRTLEDASIWALAAEETERQIVEAEKHDARILSVLDPDYPHLLAATKDDPLLLYVRGQLPENPEKAVAIIGTREPTLHGERITTRITEFFVETGWSIVSGLAKGCDSAAHQAAINAGGHTVAVLAHGLQMIYPRINIKLAENILATGGALISEYPFGREIHKAQYVKRDRTQAGLAQGVIMIQSDLVGGSLHASRAALEYNRWLAVPFPTEKDRERNEPKIQANLTISIGDNVQRSQLLKCPVGALKNVLILRSREDYAAIIDGYLGSISDAEPNVPGTLQVSNNPPQPLFSDSTFARSEASDADNNRAPKSAILQAPPPKIAKSFWIDLSSNSPAIAAAINARLAYLTSRFNAIATERNATLGTMEDADRGRWALALDDFFYQMEQGLNLLLAVEEIEERVEVPEQYNGVNHAVIQHGASIQNLGHAAEEDLQFIEMLITLRESSTHRLISVFPASAKQTELELATAASPNEREFQRVEEIDIAEICERFNNVVRRVLYR